MKPDEMKTDDEESSSDESSVSEDRCKDIKMMAMDVSPDEFSPMDLKIPTEAEDGAEVSVMLTGMAKGGFLQDVYGTEMVHDEEKQKGRLSKTLNGEEEE